MWKENKDVSLVETNFKSNNATSQCLKCSPSTLLRPSIPRFGVGHLHLHSWKRILPKKTCLQVVIAEDADSSSACTRRNPCAHRTIDASHRSRGKDTSLGECACTWLPHCIPSH